MTSVFIVRPFGKKSVTVKDKKGKDAKVEVDFDEADRLLIKAALAKNNLIGQTTGAITQAGNIRLDMFQMMIAYDLVIVDISVDNANVFYELGVRHGLRPNGTILIRFKTDSDVPFDLKTDRYIVYDRENPAAAVDLLASSIRDTISATRRSDRRPDSPVFLLLPELAPPDPAKLIVIPREFQEAVERAEGDGAHGLTMLALLGEEAKRTAWRRQGLRLVARAQRRMNGFNAALESWEYIRKDWPDDIEANLQLATIFQRLGDPVSASQACRRVLDNPEADRKSRADARSQLARNEKAAWVKDFSALTTEEERRAQAISDGRLTEAFEGYMAGFAEDLNDYYSGINALGLLTAIVELAKKEPAAWAGRYATEKKAAAALEEFGEQLEYVRGVVRMSLDNAAQQARRSGRPDEWLPPSDAQYKLLTAKNPDFVRNAYKAAKTAGKAGFSVASEAVQVGIFRSLGLFPENCSAALEVLGVPESRSVLSAAASSTAVQLSVSFEAVDPNRTFTVAQVLWTSYQLDACLLRLTPAVDDIAPLPFARELPHVGAPPHPHAYVIGYPNRDQMSLFLQDNVILDHEGPPSGKPSDPDVIKVQYRATTGAGTAGSPVLNGSSWEVIAMHRADGSLRRLNQQSGTDQVSEGVWIQSVLQAVRREIGGAITG